VVIARFTARGLFLARKGEAMSPCQVNSPIPQRRVLVVEDHADGREALRLLLSALGYKVHVADNGLEGVSAALRLHPDVVILDIRLPRLDGRAAARLLRTVLGDRVVLVAYTAYDPGDLDDCPDENVFDDWLVKPANVEALRHCLERRDAQSDGRHLSAGVT
jgi:CheY-like chemotaxis protein